MFDPTPPARLPSPRRWGAVAALWIAAFGGVGDASANPQIPEAKSTESKESASRPIRIFAATSVAGVVEALAIEAVAPQSISLNQAASSTLARQALGGAPFDVFVSANPEWMMELGRAQLLLAKTSVAANVVVFAVPQRGAQNPRLPLGHLPPGRIAAAQRQAPLGMATEGLLAEMSLSAADQERLVRAPSARAALEWVATGDVSGGFLFASDVASDPRVDLAWRLPPQKEKRVLVVAGVSREAHPLANRVLSVLTSAEGQAAFAAAHFLPHALNPAEASSPRGDPLVDVPPPKGPTVDLPAAIVRSLFVAGLALLFTTPLAVFAGYVLARRRRDAGWRAGFNVILSSTLLLPLALPPVVTGWLLLVAFGERGLATDIPFTVWACVLASTVVALPLVTLTSRSAFEAVDPRLEELAQTLGAPPVHTFRSVTLPLALPGVIAGGLLGFARAVGEFGATVVVAGNTEGQTRTLALAVEAVLQTPGAPGVQFLVAFSVAMTVAVVVTYELLNRWQRRRLGWSQ